MEINHSKKITLKTRSENKVIQPKYKEKHSLLDKESVFYSRKIINTPVGTLGRVSTGVDY